MTLEETKKSVDEQLETCKKTLLDLEGKIEEAKKQYLFLLGQKSILDGLQNEKNTE